MVWLAALGCALVCLAAGLGTAPAPQRDRGALLLCAAQLLGGAALGWLTGWLLDLTPGETAGLAMVGAAPGTAAAIPLVALAGGNATLAHATLALGGFGAVLTVPFVAALAGGSAAALYWLILAAALPAWAGMALRDRVDARVHRLAPVLAGLVLAAMILAALTLGTAGAAFWPLTAGALVLAIAQTLAGHAAGAALGRGDAGAATGSIVLPMRNVAVPMLAGFVSGVPAAPLAAGIYGVVMYLPALAVIVLRLRRSRGA